jgi:hypothetical protein
MVGTNRAQLLNSSSFTMALVKCVLKISITALAKAMSYNLNRFYCGFSTRASVVSTSNYHSTLHVSTNLRVLEHSVTMNNPNFLPQDCDPESKPILYVSGTWSKMHCSCKGLDHEPLQSLLQINVPQRHSEFLSFSPDGPSGRGQM